MSNIIDFLRNKTTKRIGIDLTYDTDNKHDVNLSDVYKLTKSGKDQNMKGEFDQALMIWHNK